MRWSILALVFPAVALAVPPTLTHSGRLLDSDGGPLNGGETLTLRLYDAAGSSGSVLWTEAENVSLVDGYFTSILGDDVPFPATVFDGSMRWLGITVNGAELSPRTPIHAMPYAFHADDADAVSGLTRTQIETALTLGGNEIAGVANDLAGLDAATRDASRLTGGTVAFDRLPTGDGAEQVAAGDHISRVFVHRYQTETGDDYPTSWTNPGYGDFAYTKRSATSHLKITWTASLRTILGVSGSGVCMWRYLLNSDSCGPAPLTLFQHDTGSNPSSDKHMPHATTVVCEGVAAGPVTFTHQARRRDGDEDCYFGYSGASYGGPFYTTVVIEEVEY